MCIRDRLCDGSAIPLIVTPGDRIEVNSLCDLARNYTVEGSEESQLLKQFNTQYGLSLIHIFRTIRTKSSR